MKHLQALAIKFVIISAVLEILFITLTRLSFGRILVISLTVTVASYLIGDLGILRRFSNIFSSLADIVLSFLTIYMFNYIYTNPGLNYYKVLVASVVIGIAEWVFHKFLYRLFDHAEEKKTAV